jgi:hypothetical protein
MPTFVIGDLHGHLDRLMSLLAAAGLAGAAADGRLAWTGGTSTLWLMGDLVDAGPDSIGVLDLVLRLQEKARAVGGQVRALLGNHDLLLLAAWRFPDYVDHATEYEGRSLLDHWRDNGGRDPDLARLTTEHIAWLTRLPAMAHEGDTLLAHADSVLYANYGGTVDEANFSIGAVAAGDDLLALERLLLQFEEQRAFLEDRTDGSERLEQFLEVFGGRRLVHGHTPIGEITGQPAEQIIAPLVYQCGRAVDVDGGIRKGGQGFVYRLDEQ